MFVNRLKSVIPDREMPVRILFGPFRGAVIVLNPRSSLRKIFGLYERELNCWLQRLLPAVSKIIDVGANDGYFTFGCAAAFARLGTVGEIISFEPQEQHARTLRQTIGQESNGTVRIKIVQSLVGSQAGPGVTTLDAIRWTGGDPDCRANTLIKIDVEGAEFEVLKGASSWLNSSNHFLIEVHTEPLLERIIQLFENRKLQLTRIDQQPALLLGREMRSHQNWWLVR
jgi:hypothetical protein